ncbi:MAG TPA: hypothetical protein VGE07_19515 [Herpetosiphonaceae bacterium]
MTAITDIWFVTPLPLRDLARALRMTDVTADAENYWEWIIGTLGGMTLDITRTHTLPAAEVPTRIFRLEAPRAFAAVQQAFVAARLQQAGITPIFLGAWVYRSGDEFELQVAETRA